jgi:hypothetical protein
MTDIKKAIDKIIANRERYQVAEAYYEGINDEVFQNQRWYRLFRYEKNRFNTFTPFRFNFSKTDEIFPKGKLNDFNNSASEKLRQIYGDGLIG